MENNRSESEESDEEESDAGKRKREKKEGGIGKRGVARVKAKPVNRSLVLPRSMKGKRVERMEDQINTLLNSLPAETHVFDEETLDEMHNHLVGFETDLEMAKDDLDNLYGSMIGKMLWQIKLKMGQARIDDSQSKERLADVQTILDKLLKHISRTITDSFLDEVTLVKELRMQEVDLKTGEKAASKKSDIQSQKLKGKLKGMKKPEVLNKRFGKDIGLHRNAERGQSLKPSGSRHGKGKENEVQEETDDNPERLGPRSRIGKDGKLTTRSGRVLSSNGVRTNKSGKGGPSNIDGKDTGKNRTGKPSNLPIEIGSFNEDFPTMDQQALELREDLPEELKKNSQKVLKKLSKDLMRQMNYDRKKSFNLATRLEGSILEELLLDIPLKSNPEELLKKYKSRVVELVKNLEDKIKAREIISRLEEPWQDSNKQLQETEKANSE